MAFQPVPVHRRSLWKQIANVLEHPLDVVKTLWNKDSCAGGVVPTMEVYTEAANKCIDSATTFLDYARLFVEAKRAYDLCQKEIELGRIRKEISALKLIIPLLVEPAVACQIESTSIDAVVEAGANFVLGKPVRDTQLRNNLDVAVPKMEREHRRHFRHRVDIP
jgi:hypothetical protein